MGRTGMIPKRPTEAYFHDESRNNGNVGLINSNFLPGTVLLVHEKGNQSNQHYAKFTIQAVVDLGTVTQYSVAHNYSLGTFRSGRVHVCSFLPSRRIREHADVALTNTGDKDALIFDAPSKTWKNEKVSYDDLTNTPNLPANVAPLSHLTFELEYAGGIGNTNPPISKFSSDNETDVFGRYLLSECWGSWVLRWQAC